jgi:glycosyltransferase involved in cell wall biosynthesis
VSVLYHLTVPDSPMSSCEAVHQEAELLRKRFGGSVFHLYPGRTPGTRFPRRWWGLQHLFGLRRAELGTSLHHVFNPDPYPFSVLRFLRRPIVYSVVAGVRAGNRVNAQRLAALVHTVVVSSDVDRSRMQDWGVKNTALVRPGVEVERFRYRPLPAEHPPTLLMGSAPWTMEQFHTKGVELLLALAQQTPELRLIFLWRGVLADEMNQRVRDSGLEGRVQVLNEHVDVNRTLARVHAAVILATGNAVIKAYPHSLLEALAAGKPVLVSSSVPMARYVEQQRCGVVVRHADVGSLKDAVRELMDAYSDYQKRASNLAVRDFSAKNMLCDYGRIYGALG